MCIYLTEIKHRRLVFNSLNVGSDTNLSHPYFPRVTGGPGGGFRDVVDIVIVKHTKYKCTAEAKKDLFQLKNIVISKYHKIVEIDPQADPNKKETLFQQTSCILSLRDFYGC